MSKKTTEIMPAPLPAMSEKVAIVGVGETDYALDYKASRAKPLGYERPTVEELATDAFERALADSELRREDIDGLSVSFLMGGPDANSTAEMFGLKPRYCIENGGIMAGPLPRVCADISLGLCDTVVMIFAVSSRSSGKQYGGSTYGAQGNAPSSYYYYHPWGWSSQAAHWALMFRHYQATYGVTEADLGAVPLQLRKNAMLNPNAIMRSSLSLDDYLNSRYIVRPLHLFDMCLVNDGAVCLIVRRADKAIAMPHVPVLVAGWGDAKIINNKMHYMVRERLRPQMQEAGAQALAMAGLKLDDVDHFEGYDASSIHLVNQLEGYGFVAPGEGLAAFKSGDFAPAGKLGVNTGGGMISGSYMHGWNQVVEVVHQLRHEAGDRQVSGAQVAMSSLTQTDQTHPIIYTRGA
jgi:acetyl-CoA acetyltransferase